MPSSMTPLEWSQAQLKDPAICQIIQAIQTKTLDTIKFNQNMSSDHKVFLRIRKQFKLKHGILYRKTKVNDKARLQLVLPPSHRPKAMADCHDQVGHLGQYRVLELLRDRFYWSGMHMDVASYINSCPRCIRRKSQPDTAPLLNIEITQPLELIHLDYLQIEPSKGNRKCVNCYRPFYQICSSLSIQKPDCFGNCQASVEQFYNSLWLSKQNYFRPGLQF